MIIFDVDELAKYLKLKPVTVYKLARQGRIPGFKVGGSLRFRKDTIDNWIIEQESSGMNTEDGADNESIEEAAEVCGLGCGRQLKNPADVGGTCTTEGCEHRICRRCWNVLGRRSCASHAKITVHPDDDVIAQASEGLPTEEARLREDMFIERFKTVLSQTRELVLPESNQVVRLKGVVGKVQESNELSRLVRIASGRGERKVLQKQYPLCRSVSYALKNTNSQFVADAGKVALIAKTLVRFDRYLESGADGAPMTESELIAEAGAEIEAAQQSGVFRIVGWYAPTGWSESAQHLLQPGQREGVSLVSPAAVFLLIGPDIRRVVYNESDRRLKSLAKLYSGELPEERLERCYAALCQEMRGTPTLNETLAEARLGFDRSTVIMTMQRFAREREEYQLRTLHGVGKILVRREN